MPDTKELSEARRALLEKYLRGDPPQTTTVAGSVKQRAEVEVIGPRERVVAIQTGGSKLPFFFLHGHWKGNGFFCYPLARDLGPDQPFYVLEPYRLDGLSVPPTLEAIAAAHLKSLRTIQPEGPYLLGGLCNGGLVAYEMARQLHTEGQRVDLLVLLNPIMAPAYPALHRLLHGAISCFGELVGLGKDKQLDWFLRLLHLNFHLRYSYYRGLKAAACLPTAEQGELGGRGNKVGSVFARRASLFPPAEVLRQYGNIFEWVDLDYRPPSLYPGRITFFWPGEETFNKAGWRKVVEAKAKEIEVYVIPGTQQTWKTEYLSALAQRLRVCLSKAQASTQS
jgi:hypothetical protein